MRRRRNPSVESSKANIVESLLRLGDIARNEHVGEVQVALGKAKLLIDKYGLIQFDGRYQQLVEKLAAHLRGEKVTRDEEPKREQDPWDEFIRRTWERSRPYSAYRKEQRRQRTEARREAQKQRTAQRREEKLRQRQEQKASYVRPSVDDKIEWIWTLSYSPKRGKAGERWRAYYGAKTIREMLKRGGRRSDVKWNIQHGYMRIKT